ncbi:hypothetical protein D3C78_1211850 [compost metagenome]
MGDAVVAIIVSFMEITEGKVKQGADVLQRYRCTCIGTAGFALEQNISQTVVVQSARRRQGDTLFGCWRRAVCSRLWGGQYFVAVRQILPGPLVNILWGMFAGNILCADVINLRQLIPAPWRIVYF